MSRIIEEVETHTSGDAWANFTPSAHGDSALSAMIEQYINSGGRIVEIPPGVSAERLDIPLPDTHSALFSVENQKQYHAAKHQRKVYKQQASDTPLVKGIDRLLDTAITSKEIYRTLHCCSETFQRLLTLYFSDDPRAKPFFHRARETREEEIRAKVKAALAKGLVGIANIAEHCGVSRKHLSAMNKELHLNVPKSKTGRAKA